MATDLSKDTGRPWIVVSFFTESNGYKPDALKMVASCEKFGLDYFVADIKGEGSWLKNVRFKPRFMRQMLTQFPDRQIVWIDVDGVIQQYPDLFDTLAGAESHRAYIVGVHYRAGVELLTNTVFLRNSPRTVQMIDSWISVGESMPDKWEQKTLQILLMKHPEWPVFTLPPTYSQIFDTMRGAGRPVIEHFQASRRLRAKGVMNVR